MVTNSQFCKWLTRRTNPPTFQVVLVPAKAITWNVAPWNLELSLAPLFVSLLDGDQDLGALGALVHRILVGKNKKW